MGKTNRRCECPDDAVSHKANNCQNTNTRKYNRDGEPIYLCYDCVMNGDILWEDYKEEKV